MRKALLCGEGFEHRKQWIEDRLELLANNFSLSVASFAVMDNHLHVLCRLNPDQARNWSAAEVLHRWMAIYPPTTLDIEDPRIVQAWIVDQARDQEKSGFPTGFLGKSLSRGPDGCFGLHSLYC